MSLENGLCDLFNFLEDNEVSVNIGIKNINASVDQDGINLKVNKPKDIESKLLPCMNEHSEEFKDRQPSDFAILEDDNMITNID